MVASSPNASEPAANPDSSPEGAIGAGSGSAERAEVTRLAPSPTGALHLGNARTFLVNWLMARQRGWRIVMRVEDLDTPRVKAGAIDDLLGTLEWLGLDWDEGPIVQSADLGPYRRAMAWLASRGLVYPCDLSRKEIEEAASAPHESPGGEVVFPSSLRPAERPAQFDQPERSWRFVVEEGEVVIEDGFAGRRVFEPARSVGDLVVWTKRGQPSYQLAVVVDDSRQGVTRVVRGDDLLDSAARQTLLYRALGIGREPAWFHLPLVRGEDGRRLAKRHGDTRIDHYRGLGVSAERVLGLLAWWSGIRDPGGARREMGIGEVLERFDRSTMPREDIVFTPEDDQWLRS